MADYRVVDTEKLESDLTSVADEVRTLADTTSKMSLEVMKGNIAEANEKVDSQAAIISQIKRTLQGKASSGGEEITPGFTSEKYKKWLEINGYTIVEFTLTSQAMANFNINHPLGRPANSIICFRADMDGIKQPTGVCFAVSADGKTTDQYLNRLCSYSPYFGIIITCRLGGDYRAFLENTDEYIQFRGNASETFNSGDYYLAVL